jgi:hypothetical protein
LRSKDCYGSTMTRSQAIGIESGLADEKSRKR